MTATTEESVVAGSRLRLTSAVILLAGWMLCWNCGSLQAQDQKIELIEAIGSSELPKIDINCITQDSAGFLWIGTWKGLFRFDGREIINYSLAFTNKIGRKISSLYLDNKGNLWIGTYSEGLFVLNPKNQQIRSYNVINNIRTGNIVSITGGRNHRVMIASYDGIFIYDTQKNQFEPKSLTYSEQNNNFRLTQVFEDSKNNLWVGSDQGILKFDRNRGRLRNTGQLGKKYIHRIIELDNGWIAVSNLAGIDLFEVINGELVHLTQNPLGRTLAGITGESNYCLTLKSNPSLLWVGTHQGIRIADIKTGQLLAEPVFKEAGIKSGYHVESIFEDRQGIVWVGSNKGLFRYDRNQKPFYLMKPDQPGTEVSTIAIKARNTIWAGTRGSGIFLVETDADGHRLSSNKLVLNSEQIDGYLKEDIFSIETGLGNDLWISTKGKGIVYADNIRSTGSGVITANAVNFNQDNGLADNHVMTLYRDSKGTIWGGCWSNGLIYYSKDDNAFRILQGTYARELKKSPIVKIIESGPNRFYLGTRGNGLILIEISSTRDSIIHMEHYLQNTADSTSICNNFISDLITMPGNDLWIATEYGISVLRAGEKRFTNIGLHGEIKNPVIQSIIPASDAEIWAATENGICKLLLSKGMPQQIRNYTSSDGLGVSFFNTSCSVMPENGYIYFGGMEGICYFNPMYIQDSRTIPPLLITKISLQNRVLIAGEEYDGVQILQNSAWFTNSIRLKYFQNTLSFSFSGMDFSVPEKISYAYKLEGLDKSWTYTQVPECNYPRLKPGRYVLKVRCSNSDGIWNNEVTTLSINILPPWWYSNIAYGIYFLLFLVMAYFAYRLITYRQRLRIRQLEQEQEIELNDMRMQFYTNISHEFRTPLTLIMGLTGRLRLSDDPEKRNDFYEKIDRNARILLRLITDLMDLPKIDKNEIRLRKDNIDPTLFFKTTCESFAHLFPTKGVEFVYTSKITQATVISGDPVRLESVVYNLLSNAFKFTPNGGRVDCELQLVRKLPELKHPLTFLSKSNHYRNFVAFSVTDTGIGMSKAQVKSVFDRFNKNRFYNNTEPNANSYGIGLLFTRSLVELHGGVIEVESEKGKGTRVTVYLPYSEDTELKIITHPTLSQQILSSPIPEKSVNSESSGKTSDERIILVVDDNVEVRELLRDILTPAYTIAEATDGVDGWNKACELVPDLIISDVIMPEMDGNTLCEKLKTSNITNHIPVILLTALPTNEDRIKGLKHGADSYIPKPFDVEHLLVRVQKLISSRLQLKEKYMKDFLIMPEKNPGQEVNPSAEYIARIKKVIEQNLTNPEYDVADLCRDLGTSRMQLYRKLKATVGYSANELIRKIKLYKAAELMLRGDLNIAQVTYEVGFSDLQYFRKCFKEEFSMTPSQYIRANTGEGDQNDQKIDPFEQE